MEVEAEFGGGGEGGEGFGGGCNEGEEGCGVKGAVVGLNMGELEGGDLRVGGQGVRGTEEEVVDRVDDLARDIGGDGEGGRVCGDQWGESRHSPATASPHVHGPHEKPWVEEHEGIQGGSRAEGAGGEAVDVRVVAAEDIVDEGEVVDGSEVVPEGEAVGGTGVPRGGDESRERSEEDDGEGEQDECAEEEAENGQSCGEQSREGVGDGCLVVGEVGFGSKVWRECESRNRGLRERERSAASSCKAAELGLSFRLRDNIRLRKNRPLDGEEGGALGWRYHELVVQDGGDE